VRPRIVRFHSSDGGRTAATQTLIRDFPNEPQGQSHQISSITIGPDGKLYIHMGDGFTSATAQNLDSARGKILRLNLDGSAPADNPFYNAGDGIGPRDMVWVYGVRNPFGGAWRLSDGKHFTVENGPSVDRISVGVVGRNYLWNGTDASMTNYAAYNWNPAHGPVNIAFQQSGTGAFDGGFPAATANFAFITESGPTYGAGPQSLGKRIVSFNFAANGSVLTGPDTLAQYGGAGQATAVALAFGPDGLYFSELYKDTGAASPTDRGAGILRIRYVGGGGACAPSCPADFNQNGTISVQDIFDFLAAYFAGDMRADFNHSGAISVQDIFDYLAAYFAGCP
jgi:glucose/arabinose dehydrogenase